ncbi:MAG: hypothetical protein US86_C0009G0027 [Candidatus Daviesbacteria bacterium GW2011_GWA2_38_24]|uniref:Uncharacterized protein n=1 Tax=Candidatus Daviesbacteria bacterium GW2011_GWA2_38_24 TaxID=1618422 RepID=A0A0G0LWA3_9BACT|nr:MAG: hypothetical protein US86_C0009G0027 [Candidatus Daviesbacteria bacterium GW2011_GWA2_38_24]OGE23484.1 MAG: hypothetical protein A2688_01570 [Candidatus Daviesbacteria bacterium RIFCSPHIGHO2_01_FULL_38_8]
MERPEQINTTLELKRGTPLVGVIEVDSQKGRQRVEYPLVVSEVARAGVEVTFIPRMETLVVPWGEIGLGRIGNMKLEILEPVVSPNGKKT